MSPDQVNALFEFGGFLFVLLHIRQTLKDRIVRGVSWVAVAFFTVWGGWNLFYYPALGQWWSFGAGAIMFAGNIVWVSLLIHFTIKEAQGEPYSNE